MALPPTNRLRVVIALLVGLALASCGGAGGDSAGAGSVTAREDTAASPLPSAEDTVTSTTSGPSAPLGAADGSTATDGSTAADGDGVAPDSGSGGSGIAAIDWWGCWLAADARGPDGQAPPDGGRVALVPNCASGPSSVGPLGDLSHPTDPPLYRDGTAAGHPSIEFTFEGDTLLQTNGGDPWSGAAVLPASADGVTLAWVGTMTDVEAHDVKYLVSGLTVDMEYPMLLVEGEGPNRFAGYGGGTVEARSSDGTIVDGAVHGVILYLSPDGGGSVVEVDGRDVTGDQDSRMRTDVVGLTVGNLFSRGFSTTDHRFVFLGLYRGQLPQEAKAELWAYLSGL